VLLLPITNPLGILGVAEIVLVFRSRQPSALQFPLPGLATVRLETIALALCAATIGKKKFAAMQALGSGSRRLHRSRNQTDPVSEKREPVRKKIQPSKKTQSEKKEEEVSANSPKKIQRKKIPL
jgi:hypothetical protein